MKEKISVIVPAYNCENYIKQCLESILHQTYKNIEIIVIDDGSIDNTKKYCHELAQVDDRIKLVSIENHGVSYARNLGLEMANGEYVVFIDSDDYFTSHILEDALRVMHKGGLVIWDYSVIGEKNNRPHLRIPNGVLDRDEAVASSLCRRVVPEYELGGYYRAVWGKMFDLDVIKRENLRFPEDLPVGEDAYFLISYLASINEDIIAIDSAGYNYRILSNSAVRKYRDNLLELDCRQMDYMMGILKAKGLLSSQPVVVSFSNWKWQLVFSSLLDNSLAGYQRGLLKRKDIFKDARDFCKIYHTTLKSCPVKSQKLYKKYQVIQPLYGKIPFTWLCLLYIGISRAKRK